MFTVSLVEKLIPSRAIQATLSGFPDAMAMELISVAASPFSIKAKWALDFHKISFKNTDYTPGVGERWLRRKTGKATGLITVPVMFTPEGVLMDSFDIAHWTDAHSERKDAKKLFPEGQLEAISRWNRACDDVLEFGRAAFLQEVQDDKLMRRGMMPPILNSLGPFTDWLSGIMFKGLLSKYKDVSNATSAAKAAKAFEEMRKVIKGSDGYILGTFSYADIAMAVACDTIEPLGPPLSKAPEAMRRPRPELKAKYGELVQYRDKIFKEHFPSISPSDLALSMKK